MSNKLKFQWAKAAAMFSNYQEIIKNWGLAVNSMGFTDNQVKNQMDSISRRLQTLKADLTGMVTQAGNGGLTETIKNAISTIDRLIKYLNSIPASTYNIIGTFTRLVAEIYVINRAINAVKASSIASEISLKDLGTKGAASMEILTIAVNGLGAAFNRILPVLLATLAVEGIMYVIDSLNGETDAINKESEAMTDNLAVKQQQIEVS